MKMDENKGNVTRGRKRGYLNEKSRDSRGRLWWDAHLTTLITE